MGWRLFEQEQDKKILRNSFTGMSYSINQLYFTISRFKKDDICLVTGEGQRNDLNISRSDSLILSNTELKRWPKWFLILTHRAFYTLIKSAKSKNAYYLLAQIPWLFLGLIVPLSDSQYCKTWPTDGLEIDWWASKKKFILFSMKLYCELARE